MAQQTIKIHAEKSASGSFRWAICHASVKRQRGKADNGGNMAAKRGTVAHDLGEKCLKMKDTIPLSMAFGKDARVNRDGSVTYLPSGMNDADLVTVDEQIVAWVEAYIEFVNNLAMGGELMVEQSLSIQHITGEDGAKGTTDVGVLYEDEVAIADLKTGFNKVMAAYPLEGDLFKFAPKDFQLRRLFEEVKFPNPQLVIYADSLIETVRFFREIKRVRLIVFQPSLNHTDEFVLSIEDFDQWVQWLREQAAAAEDPEPRVVPGEKQCQYCRAFPCPEAQALAVNTAIDDFDAAEPQMKQVNRHELTQLKRVAPLLRMFADRVDAMVHAELQAGRPVPGWKMVDGDLGDRKWTDEAAVMATLGQWLMPHEFIKSKIESPAQIESMVVNKRATINRKLTRDQWDELAAYIARAPGSPKVVPDSDPRPSVTVDPSSGFEFDDTPASAGDFFT